MGIFIFSLLFLVAIISLSRNKIVYFYVLFGSIFFLKFIMLKITPDWAGGSSIYLYLLILILVLIIGLNKNNNFNKFDSKTVFMLFISFLSIQAYLFLSALLKGINPMNYVLFTKNFFYGYIVFVFFLTIKKDLYKNLNKFFFIILAIESILGLMQYLGPDSFADYFKIIEYSWNGGKTQLLGKSFYINRLVLGTLLRPAQYSDIIVLLTIYFSGQFIFSSNLYFKKKYYLLILLISALVVLLSGIRTAFISLIVGVLLLNYYKGKVNSLFFTLLISMIIFAFYQSYYQISQLSAAGKVGIDNPIERISGLLTVFKDINKLNEHNALTLIRSIWLIPYISVNPLFGAGLYWKTGYYGQLAAGSDLASWSDATLMFFIVEYGLLGLFLLLSPYLIVLKYLKKKIENNNYRIIHVLFIVLLVQTITDPGLFNIYSSILFLTLAGMEINKSRAYIIT